MHIIKAKEKDLGGFAVRRLLPAAHYRNIGPWVFFDHMGPADFPAGEGVNVRPHPHINLATVTYLFEGEILHRDSLGSEQLIQPGDINLMIAGSGIVHSERETELVRNQPHRTHGLQLWLALPEAFEEVAPEFHHYSALDIPKININGAEARVMIGEAFGLKSPVKTYSETLYLEVSLPADCIIDLPATDELALYLLEGNVSINGAASDMAAYDMLVLEPNSSNEVIATTDTRFAVVGGSNLGERFIEWNFVSSRKERIEKAKSDWKNKRFKTVPGDEKEYIPLPD